MPQITIAQWDDWVNLYINGVSVYEGHAINGTQMLEALGISFETLPIEGESAWEMCGIRELDKLKNELTQERP